LQCDRRIGNEQERGGVRHTLELKWGRGFKIWVHDRDQGRDRGMTRVKVITDKHIIKDMFWTRLARCPEGRAVNDEIEEALG
jgi:hypothetical protein